MRRVEIQAEVLAGDVFESAPPDSRRGHEIFAARPFVLGERHGAVLDADLNAVIPGKLDEWPPGFEKARPVLVQGFGPVAAYEGVDHTDTQELGCLDDVAEVLDVDARFGGVGREGIGIVAQAADGDAGFLYG